MIRLINVCKRYPGGHQALTNLTFELEDGEMAFLTGHSGAGKSTLLKLIALMERPTSGQLIVNGKNLGKLKTHQVPYHRRNLGLIFQNHQLLYDRTVFDNVALPLVIAGHRHQEVRRRVLAALDKVQLLGKEHLYPITLSGGEQQRVGIARAVVNRPKLLLADEPTGNLDPDLSAEIMGLFQDFNRVGVSVLIVTHDYDLIRSMPNRILHVEHGKLEGDYPRRDRPAANPAEGQTQVTQSSERDATDEEDGDE